MTRLSATSANTRLVLVCFFTAIDDGTAAILDALVGGGADEIELGTAA